MASGDRITKLKLATTYCVHGCRVISSVVRPAATEVFPFLFTRSLGAWAP